MKRQSDLDPVDALRAANPVRAEEVPHASLARVSASVQEQIMIEQNGRLSPVGARRTLALFSGVGATAAIALAVALSGFGAQLPGSGNDPGGSIDPGGGMASCLVYDPALLPTFEVVLDGTVTAIDGDRVTFAVNQGWKAASGSIALTRPDTSTALIGPMPDFQVGGRYLVTAAGGNINGCGYSLDYSAVEAADWAAAFAG